jgi:hypothetical protein
MLLSGSRFKKQLIVDNSSLLVLAFLGALLSFAMQFILAWYLWIRLPYSYPDSNGDGSKINEYPGTEGGRGYYSLPSGFARVPLPAYNYPNYQYANDVCRTVSIVQLVCIFLFLFNILNNVPGILKNVAIIWRSERFISEDEDGITKLHYWRGSDFTNENLNSFFEKYFAGHASILKKE